MYTADNICKMIEFLIDNIFVQFGERLFCQMILIPMGTNCAPLLADVFLYSYENEFLDNMIRSGHRRLARSLLIDNIFVQFGGRLFCQMILIPMGTNCAPLLADVFLYSYENEFLDNMIRSGHRRLARSFNPCYRYMDDLIVFNNKNVLNYLHSS